MLYFKLFSEDHSETILGPKCRSQVLISMNSFSNVTRVTALVANCFQNPIQNTGSPWLMTTGSATIRSFEGDP